MTHPLRVGSLCTGYGGLELGLAEAGSPIELAWVADPDPAATRVLAHHHPDVPNLGDITTTDWTTAEPVDMLTAGYPCQGFSHAGKRRGENDERFIWPAVADAIRLLRPGGVLLENVAGHRSLGFGRVLGDLAALGYVGSWVSVRACDVGTAHRRERVFIYAHPADTKGIGHRHTWPAGERGLPATAVAGGALLPTPRTSDTNGAGGHGEGGIDLRTAVSLLPTPKARDSKGRDPNPRGIDLNEAVALLPSPRATDGTKGGPNQRGSSGDLMLPAAVQPERWCQYAPAVARWEHVLGRLAPEPTEPGKNGPRLAPRFVEWLMGLPDGWACDVPGLTRNDRLRLLGNGVVPQQAACAIGILLARAFA